jgi:Domain of unknown function (DUF5615)
MADLYADEDFPQPVVEQLRVLGHDVLTAGGDGRAGQSIPDADVLAHATALGRAVLTHNRDDFRKLHAADPNHAGIVTATRAPRRRSPRRSDRCRDRRRSLTRRATRSRGPAEPTVKPLAAMRAQKYWNYFHAAA